MFSATSPIPALHPGAREPDAAGLAPRPSILFACRDNAGLSLLAEAIVNHAYRHVRAFSAGTTPAGRVDAAAVDCLALERIPADGLSSKPLELFGFSGAPRIDLMVAMTTGVHERIERLARSARAHVEVWHLEDVAGLVDAGARRLAYRKLLPELRTAIGALISSHAAPAFAA